MTCVIKKKNRKLVYLKIIFDKTQTLKIRYTYGYEVT